MRRIKDEHEESKVLLLQLERLLPLNAQFQLNVSHSSERHNYERSDIKL